MGTSSYVERYMAVREHLRIARLRGTDEEKRYETEMAALWSGMSDADKRTVRGVADPIPMRRAA